MIRIITDEIFAAILLIALIIFSYLSFFQEKIILFIILVIFCSCVYFLIFMMIKVFVPSMLLNQGRYSVLFNHSMSELSRKYSLINLFKWKKNINFYKIYAAIASMKLDDYTKTYELAEDIEEERILSGQIIQLRMIKAYIKINQGKFKKALESLITVKTGSLSDRQLPELFYLISLCYIELKEEKDRALNYAGVAFGLRKGNPDFKANFSIGMYVFEKNLIEAKKLLDESFVDFEKLSAFGKQRLLNYLKKIEGELGNKAEKEKYKNMLKDQFPNSVYYTATIN